MPRRGRKRRITHEAEYWALLSAGMGTVEACRQVGIGRKTGFRWRQENGGIPPKLLGEDRHSGRYLSRFERPRIAGLYERGHGVREIARRIGRAPSTVSRELRRNRLPHDYGGYDGDLAHARARERVKRPKVARLAADPELRQVVLEKLALEWNPEQISVHLREVFSARSSWHLCPETIYQALYLPARGGLTRELTRKLRTGRPMRKRRRRVDGRRVRFPTGMSISARSKDVDLRLHPGHWEGDLMSSGDRTDRPSGPWSSAIAATRASSTSQTAMTPMRCTRHSPTCCSPCPRICGSLSRGTKAARWPATPRSLSSLPVACTSPIPRAPGSAARTRTPTGSFASTSRRGRMSTAIAISPQAANGIPHGWP
jgi:transposase-like protein